jgi:hypothetical protein
MNTNTVKGRATVSGAIMSEQMPRKIFPDFIEVMDLGR